MERAPVAWQNGPEIGARGANSSGTGAGTSPASADELSRSDLIIVILLIGLIIISVVGNCLVCVAIFTDRRLRKLGNAFIVSLAIADLFVSCLVMTFALCNDLMNYWIFGDWFCDVWISFDIMCSTASILNLCAISLDRFIHIKDCLLYNQWMTRKVAISAVIIIWFISALVSFVPINLGWHRPEHFAANAWLHPLERQQEATLPDSLSAPTAPTTIQERGNNNTKLNYNTQQKLANHKAIENQSNRFYLAPETSSQTPGGSGKLGWGANDLVNSGGMSERHSPPDFVSSLAATSGGSSSVSADAVRRARQSESAQFNQVESNPQNGSQIELDPSLKAQLVGTNLISTSSSASRPTSASHLAARHLGAPEQQQKSQLPLCMLTLTPTYAVISSSISFYIPCIIMLGLYIKLFACARRHVKNIQAFSRAPAPIAPNGPAHNRALQTTGSDLQHRQQRNKILTLKPPPLKTWLKLGRQHDSTAQSINDKQIMMERKCARDANGNGKTASQDSNAPLAPALVEGGSGDARIGRKLSHEERQQRPLEHNQAQTNECRLSSQSSSYLEENQLTQQLSIEQIHSVVAVSSGLSGYERACKDAAAGAAGNCSDKSTVNDCKSGFRRQDEEKPEQVAAGRGRQGLDEERKPFLGETSAIEGPQNGRREEEGGLRRNKSCGTNRQTATQSHSKTRLVGGSAKASSGQQQQQQHVHYQQQNQQQQQSRLATHKAAITLGIIMGTFLFCWVPFFCLNIIKAFCVDCIPVSVFRAFTWLGYANSALNPIIYGIHNSEFRCAFNRIFFKHLNIKNSRYYPNRRFSYDLRHSNNQARCKKRLQPSQATALDSKQSYKSDTFT